MGAHVREEFFRDIYCSAYDECLNRAAREDLDLNCGGCKRSNGDEGEFIVSSWDVDACKRLAFVIFHPDAKKRPRG